MKITQEVRDFAAKQNAGAEKFIAANPARNGEGDDVQHGGGAGQASAKPLDEAGAEAGMAAMSELYEATGRELYMGAGGSMTSHWHDSHLSHLAHSLTSLCLFVDM